MTEIQPQKTDTAATGGAAVTSDWVTPREPAPEPEVVAPAPAPAPASEAPTVIVTKE